MDEVVRASLAALSYFRELKASLPEVAFWHTGAYAPIIENNKNNFKNVKKI
jgi:hypothetical protein